MQTRMPCGLDDQRIRLEPSNLDQARAVEEYTDTMMAECKDFNDAERLNRDNDLSETDLLTDLMVVVADWTGSTESAAQQMRKAHVLLANALQKIAEKEVV